MKRHAPSLLALILGLACSANAHARAQGQGAELSLGESANGHLGPAAAEGSELPRTRFRIRLPARTQLMLVAESLDVPVQIRIGASAADPSALQDLHGVYMDSRIALEAGPGQLSVEVLTQDPLGGDFRLSVLEGTAAVLSEQDWYTASIRRCEQVAEHALARDAVARALRALQDGFQFAYGTRELAAARRIAEIEFKVANERSKDALERVRARIHLGAVDQLDGEAVRARTTLAAARAELDELKRKASDPAERRRLASLACFLLEKLCDFESGEGAESAARELCRSLADEARLAENLALECETQARLTNLKLATGDTRGARESAELALSLAGKLADDPQLLADALAGRAGVRILCGDPAGACADAERALALNPLLESRATLLGRLAQAQIAAGRCEGALCTLEELEALQPERIERAFAAQVLLLRARLCEALGDLGRASTYLEQASQRAASDGLASCVAEVELDRGLLLLRGGDAPGARAALRATLAGAQGVRAPDLRARLLRTIAETEDELREFEPALRDFESAEASSTAEDDRHGQLLARTGTAWILYREGRLDEARRILLEAEPALEQAETWCSAADAQDTLARIALAQGDTGALARALDAGRSLLARVVSPGLVRSARAGLRSRFTGFSDLNTEWAYLACKRAGTDPVEQRRCAQEGWKRTSQWKGSILLEGLRARGATAGEDSLPTLKPGEACIDFVGGIDLLFAYVATAERTALVQLGERRPIEQRARELVQALANGTRPLSPGNFATLAAQLYADLLTPVESVLGTLPERLYIIPSPELAVLPFDCLVEPACLKAAAPRRFAQLACVIDRHEVMQCPSAAVLAQLQQHLSPERPAHLLVLADAVYHREVEPALASRQDTDASPLPSSRSEAEGIAAFVFKWDPRIGPEAKVAFFEELRKRGARLQTPALDLFLGPEARLDRVHSGLAEYTHLHFAVHGRVDPLDPRRSGLLLSWEPASGGLWRLEEVLAQRIDAQLVVLSACGTADGPVVRGEGVQSVANAFLEAGAHAVIASAWAVGDEHASILMQRVYAGMLEAGKGPGAALRDARLAFRGPLERGPGKSVLDSSVEPDTANPRVWGAWLFVGANER